MTRHDRTARPRPSVAWVLFSAGLLLGLGACKADLGDIPVASPQPDATIAPPSTTPPPGAGSSAAMDASTTPPAQLDGDGATGTDPLAPFEDGATPPGDGGVTPPQSQDAGDGATGTDLCTPNPCVNGGTCSLTGELCRCQTGFSGNRCEIDSCVGACTHGTCMRTATTPVCDCTNSGYEGNRCQTEIDECTTMPCAVGRTCSDRVNGRTCGACIAGYVDSGGTCRPATQVTVQRVGDGLGALTVAGVASCNTGCALTVPTGDAVQASVTLGAYTRVVRWSQASCNAASSCSLTTSGSTQTVSVTLQLLHNVAFVTADEVSADVLGGVNGADERCRAAAASAGLHGNFVAWISAEGPTSGTGDDIDAVTRLGTSRGWIRPDGFPVADTIASLLAKGPIYPISHDEHGVRQPERGTLTATGSDGKLYRNPNYGTCNDFTGPSGGVYGGTSGSVGANNWTVNVPFGCHNTPLRLTCFGVGESNSLSPLLSSGRLAFLSRGTLAPNAGVAAMDALCATEASAAGRSGTFLALVATVARDAAARFNTSGQNWVRADGIPWLAKASDLTAGQESLTGLNVDAQGQQVTSPDPGPSFIRTWTGIERERTRDSFSTCDDWTRASGDGGATGEATNTGRSAFAYSTFQCTGDLHVYCLQQ